MTTFGATLSTADMAEITGGMETFGAAMMLDLSADPATGYVTNSGYISDAIFDVVGSWSRAASGSGYYWEKGENCLVLD